VPQQTVTSDGRGPSPILRALCLAGNELVPLSSAGLTLPVRDTQNASVTDSAADSESGADSECTGFKFNHDARRPGARASFLMKPKAVTVI
jgi:hypothetical protein